MSRPLSPLPRFAAIDIGTNTVLLTIAEFHPDGTWHVICDEAVITRIGEGMATTPSFCAAAMDRTAVVLRDFANRCAALHVTPIAVGTAAFRRANNAAAFIERIAHECSMTIQIISGDDEATLSFTAAAHDFGNDVLVLDIGGGSTELVWRDATHQLAGTSMPIGAVSLHERCVQSDPVAPSETAQVQREIAAALDTIALPDNLSAFRAAHPTLVALAGTATTLGAMHLQLATYHHAQIHGMQMSHQQITAIVEQLAQAPLVQRRAMPGLEAARADVIYTGSLLLSAVMHRWGYDTITISDRGVRWGLLYRAATDFLN